MVEPAQPLAAAKPAEPPVSPAHPPKARTRKVPAQKATSSGPAANGPKRAPAPKAPRAVRPVQPARSPEPAPDDATVSKSNDTPVTQSKPKSNVSSSRKRTPSSKPVAVVAEATPEPVAAPTVAASVAAAAPLESVASAALPEASTAAKAPTAPPEAVSSAAAAPAETGGARKPVLVSASAPAVESPAATEIVPVAAVVEVVAAAADPQPGLAVSEESAPSTPLPAGLPSILFTDDFGTPSVAVPGAEAGFGFDVPEGMEADATVLPAEARLVLPPILFTGDGPEPVVTASKSAVGESAPLPPPTSDVPTLWLGAQDQHTVCAQWSVPTEPAAATDGPSPEGALHLRVIADTAAAPVVVEQVLPPDAHEVFVEVPAANVPYHAEIGVHTAGGGWQVLATSEPAATPPDAPKADTSYHEAVWRSPWPAPSNPGPFGAVARQPIAIEPRSVVPAPSTGFTNAVPRSPEENAPSVATALRLAALSRVEWWSDELSGESWASDGLVRSRRGSRTEEVLRVEPGQPAARDARSVPSSLGWVPTPEAPQAAAPLPTSDVSAPTAPARQFWFKVNAEVVIYGSTERDARVTIGSVPVTLRPDGTFSFRFALPDGTFPLPVAAVSADGQDGRVATLTLGRTTQFEGVVGVHPQDSSLQPPLPENAR